MTVIGVLASRDQATVWADTLATNGHADRHRSKLAVNPLAGVIGTGCGFLALLEAAEAAVLAGTDLDSIVPATVRALRRATPIVIGQVAEEQRFRFGAGCYALTGWSALCGRLVAYKLAAFAFWEPVLSTAVLSPRLEGEALPFHSPSCNQVAAIAGRQAAVLAEDGGRVGPLTIATMTRRGITILPPVEIAPARPLSGSGADAEPVSCEGKAGTGEASQSSSLAA